MATFTKIPEGETPSISVDVSRRLSKIGMRELHRSIHTKYADFELDPMIYGGFME